MSFKFNRRSKTFNFVNLQQPDTTNQPRDNPSWVLSFFDKVICAVAIVRRAGVLNKGKYIFVRFILIDDFS
jgi:hypothetical protein